MPKGLGGAVGVIAGAFVVATLAGMALVVINEFVVPPIRRALLGAAA